MEITNANQLFKASGLRDLIGEKNFDEAGRLVRDGGTLWVFTKKEFEETDQSEISARGISFLQKRFAKGKEWAGLVKNPPRDWDMDGCVHMPNFTYYIFDDNMIEI